MADVNISKYTTQVVREGSKPASPGFVVSEGQDPVNPPGTNNYVPYSGASANVELGEFGLESGFVTLDTTPTNTPTDQGTLYWDDSKSTAALIMNGTLQHIGQDVFYYVKNSSGSSIAKGTAVRFDGTDGGSGHLLIAPFLADGTYPSTYFMGVTAETIGNGSFGQVMHFGELSGINTSGFTAGALLYASTTVAGGFQTTAPVAPNNIVLIAAAVNSKNNGEIIVRPTYGSNINQDEGVKITSGTTGDLLQLQAGGLWENKAVAQVIGSAYVPSTRTITINGTTQDLSANRTYNVGTVTSVGLSSATSGVTIGSTPVTTSGTITIAIATATSTQNGLLSSTDWSTFNGKQNALTLTTTGTSGAATLVGSTLNIPIYSPDLSGYVPKSRTLTINGTAFDLSANRSWSVGTVTSVAALTLGTSGTDLNSTVANSTTTPVITLNVPTASATNRGALSAADWSTFNSKQNALTNPVTGTGTTNYLPKFTGSTTIGNSQVFDNGTNIGINTASPLAKFDILQTSSSLGGWYMASQFSATNYPMIILAAITPNKYSRIGNDGDGSFSFFTNGSSSSLGTQAMTLTSGGNLGLGVVPSSWGTLATALEIGTGGTSLSYNFSETNLGTNVYRINTGASIYKQNGIAMLYTQSSGGHAWFTAPSGTAGNAISFTQAMTLTSGGNLLVGTTTDNGEKLQVNGEITAVTRIRINKSTQSNQIFGDGNAFNISGSNNLGIRNDSGSIVFASGGATVQMLLNPSGNVGIGTNAPAFAVGSGLEIERDSETATLRLQRTGTNTSNLEIRAGESVAEFVVTSGSTPLLFSTGGSERWRITPIGILQSNGAQTIQTSTGNLTLATAGGNGNIVLSPNGTGYLDVKSFIQIDNYAAGTTVPNTAGVLRILSGSKTGWAPNDELGKIEFFGTDTSGIGVRNLASIRAINSIGNGTTTASSNGEIAFYTSLINALESLKWTIRDSGILQSNGAQTIQTSTGNLTLATAGGNGNILLSPNGTGNVGIGTSSPSSKLQIEGTGTGACLTINRTDSGTNVIDFTQSGTRLGYIGYIGNDLFLNNATASNTAFFTSNTERMRITSGGNVLIGTTTDNGAKLNVNGTIRTANPTGSTSDGWLLGRALVSGSSTPDRWIRVQIGNLYYDILSRYIGSV